VVVEGAECSSDVSTNAAAAATWRWAVVVVTVAALVGAAALSPTSTGSPSRLLAWLLFVGSSVHVASTGWFFKAGEVRRHAAVVDRRHLVVLPFCFTVCCGVAGLVIPAAWLSWILLPFFAWQFHHFQKQNLGLIVLSATSAGVDGPRRFERRIVILAGVCGIAALVADPALLQLGTYQPLGFGIAVALGGYGVVLVAGLFFLVRRPVRQRPPSYCAIYLTGLLFPLPIFVFRSPYAAVGGMTIGHGLQYLILMVLVARGAESARSGRRELASLCGIALAGGLALSVTSHLHVSDAPLLRGVFGLYLGTVCAHFMVDARLWRLSEPFPRAFLGSRIPFLVPRARTPLTRLPIDRVPI
jgi:hypothetical protein